MMHNDATITSQKNTRNIYVVGISKYFVCIMEYRIHEDQFVVFVVMIHVPL